MNRNDKNEKTTLTVYNAEDGVNKVDLPVGRLVRFVRARRRRRRRNVVSLRGVRVLRE